MFIVFRTLFYTVGFLQMNGIYWLLFIIIDEIQIE